MADSTNPDATRVVGSAKGISLMPGEKVQCTNIRQYGQP